MVRFSFIFVLLILTNALAIGEVPLAGADARARLVEMKKRAEAFQESESQASANEPGKESVATRLMWLDVDLENARFYEIVMGDLDRAIAMYKNVSRSTIAKGNQRALAYYGLVRCYERRGDYVRASKARGDLTNVNLHVDDRELVVDMMKLGRSSPRTYPLLSRYETPEVLIFEKWNNAGIRNGYEVRQAYQVEGEEGVGVQFHEFSYENSYHMHRSTQTDSVSFAPIRSVYHSTASGLFEERREEGVSIIRSLFTGTEERIDVRPSIINGCEIAYFIREMEPIVGTSLGLRVLSLSTNRIGSLPRILVEGKETIEVPAGTFDCFRVKLISDFVWISDDENRYVVQRKTRSGLTKLSKIEKDLRPESSRLVSESLGFALELPPHWYALPLDRLMRDTSASYYFFLPGHVGRTRFYIEKYRSPSDDLTPQPEVEELVRMATAKVALLAVEHEDWEAVDEGWRLKLNRNYQYLEKDYRFTYRGRENIVRYSYFFHRTHWGYFEQRREIELDEEQVDSFAEVIASYILLEDQ